MSRILVPPLHAVTDDRILARGKEFLESAREVLRSGGASMALHLRGPETGVRPMLDLARRLLPSARDSGARLVINDRVDVALAVGADGVHLGGRSLPPVPVREVVGDEMTIGVSIHTVSEAEAARDGGADYLFVGTIYASSSHPSVEPAGPDLLREVSRAVELPLVAIGGVDPSRIRDVRRAGARRVAALSAVWDSDDPAATVGDFLERLSDDSTGLPEDETKR